MRGTEGGSLCRLLGDNGGRGEERKEKRPYSEEREGGRVGWMGREREDQ